MNRCRMTIATVRKHPSSFALPCYKANLDLGVLSKDTRLATCEKSLSNCLVDICSILIPLCLSDETLTGCDETLAFNQLVRCRAYKRSTYQDGSKVAISKMAGTILVIEGMERGRSSSF